MALTDDFTILGNMDRPFPIINPKRRQIHAAKEIYRRSRPANSGCSARPDRLCRRGRAGSRPSRAIGGRRNSRFPGLPRRHSGRRRPNRGAGAPPLHPGSNLHLGSKSHRQVIWSGELLRDGPTSSSSAPRPRPKGRYPRARRGWRGRTVRHGETLAARGPLRDHATACQSTLAGWLR